MVVKKIRIARAWDPPFQRPTTPVAMVLSLTWPSRLISRNGKMLASSNRTRAAKARASVP